MGLLQASSSPALLSPGGPQGTAWLAGICSPCSGSLAFSRVLTLKRTVSTLIRWQKAAFLHDLSGCLRTSTTLTCLKGPYFGRQPPRQGALFHFLGRGMACGSFWVTCICVPGKATQSLLYMSISCYFFPSRKLLQEALWGTWSPWFGEALSHVLSSLPLLWTFQLRGLGHGQMWLKPRPLVRYEGSKVSQVVLVFPKETS